MWVTVFLILSVVMQQQLVLYPIFFSVEEDLIFSLVVYHPHQQLFSDSSLFIAAIAPALDLLILMFW